MKRVLLILAAIAVPALIVGCPRDSVVDVPERVQPAPASDTALVFAEDAVAVPDHGGVVAIVGVGFVLAGMKKIR